MICSSNDLCHTSQRIRGLFSAATSATTSASSICECTWIRTTLAALPHLVRRRAHGWSWQGRRRHSHLDTYPRSRRPWREVLRKQRLLQPTTQHDEKSYPFLTCSKSCRRPHGLSSCTRTIWRRKPSSKDQDRRNFVISAELIRYQFDRYKKCTHAKGGKWITSSRS